jgi:hypothetical protein
MEILFTKEVNGASIKEGTRPKISVLAPPKVIIPNSGNDGFSIDFGEAFNDVTVYSISGNVIKVNAVDVTGLGAERYM